MNLHLPFPSFHLELKSMAVSLFIPKAAAVRDSDRSYQVSKLVCMNQLLHEVFASAAESFPGHKNDWQLLVWWLLVAMSTQIING